MLGLAMSAFAAPGTSYIGAAACAQCHADAHRKWSQSRHSKMVQPATTASVKGDFSRSSVQLRGTSYLLHQRGGQYFITESYLTGRPQEHHVDYTLGNRRIQHYLTTLPGGRILVLPPSWDVERKQWFHNLDIGDPDETNEVMVQVWNKSCFSCHVSQQEKNFDGETNQYKTAWLDFGTNCERCHGPGSQHITDYSAPGKPTKPVNDIILQTRLDPARNTMVCAQCHSFRDIYAKGYQAGADYYNYFLPILEYDQPVDKDPAYWPDGRTRRFSNDALGLWQSECFLKGGATCLSCHNSPHETEIEKNPQLRPDANALCTQCHASIGKSLSAHTRHAPASTGSSCVECHMPRTVLSIKAEIRDHSMSIPVPENTIKHGIPNACGQCHKDHDAQWALKRMARWYGTRSRQKLIRRADAFAQARLQNDAAIPALTAILAVPSEGPLARANAIGYLARFTGHSEIFTLLQSALSDQEPLVRATAALCITPGPANRQRAIESLIEALNDPVTTVRESSAVALVSLGISKLPGEEGERLERGKQLFRARAELNEDDAQQDLGAGKFFLLTGDSIAATKALKLGLTLDPAIEAQYFLAYAYAAQGKVSEAREILQAIPPNDPQYAKSQRLLKIILQLR